MSEEKMSKKQKEEFITNVVYEYLVKNGVESIYESQAKFAAIEEDKRKKENLLLRYKFLTQKQELRDSEKEELEYADYLIRIQCLNI